jgi:hypothetical protein
VTQPDHVPLKAQDRIRPSDRLGLPGTWVQDRPAELTGLTPPVGEQFGVTGPDLGFGLKLAKRFLDRLVLTEGEDPHDALAGCFACGTRRAASFGRAPVIYDMEWAYTLWGYLAQAPAELVALRVPLFRGAGHDYVDQRRIVDTVDESALRLTPAQVRERLDRDWRTFLVP